MSSKNFFPPRPDLHPTVYAYKILNASDREGLIKVGFTTRDARGRIKEQLGTAGLRYEIILEESAMRHDGSYQMPESIRSIAMGGEFNEFDLNEFFKAERDGDDATFKYEEYVQKWLDLIRGAYLPTSTDHLKLGAKKPALPFSDVRLLHILTHTFWFLPSVASAYAMKNLMSKRSRV